MGRNEHKKNTQVTCRNIVFKIYNTRVWSEVQKINQNLHFHNYSASLVAQMVKNSPAVQETWVWSLGWEDPLEKGMATHSSILAWRIPMQRKAWQATVHGVAESDMTERISTHRGYSISETHPLGKIFSNSALNLDELCWPQERDMGFQTKLIAEGGWGNRLDLFKWGSVHLENKNHSIKQDICVKPLALCPACGGS